MINYFLLPFLFLFYCLRVITFQLFAEDKFCKLKFCNNSHIRLFVRSRSTFLTKASFCACEIVNKAPCFSKATRSHCAVHSMHVLFNVNKTSAWGSRLLLGTSPPIIYLLLRKCSKFLQIYLSITYPHTVKSQKLIVDQLVVRTSVSVDFE